MKNILVVAVVLILSACQTTQQIKLVSSFDVAEYQKQLEPTGKNTIKGSALLRKNNGDVVTCAGLEVSLIPKLPYSFERIEEIYGKGSKGFRDVNSPKIDFTPNYPSFQDARKSVICNSQGQFIFEKVKDGDYFIVTSITWMSGYISYTPQYSGGSMFKEVNVSKGGTVDLTLSY